MDEEFKKLVHRNAIVFRHKKIKEVFSKENPMEMEIFIVNRWVEMFGNQL